MARQWRNTVYLGDAVLDGESPVLSAAADGQRVRRRITLAPLQSVGQAMVDFLGYPTVVTGTNKDGVACRYVSRSIPHAFKGVGQFPAQPPREEIPGVHNADGSPIYYTYPAPPIQSNYGYLFAKSMPGHANVQPLGSTGANLIPGKGKLDPGVGYYNTAKLDFEYRSLTYDVLPDFDTLLVNPAGPLASTATAPIPDEGFLDASGFPPRYVTAYLRTSKRVINLRRGLIWFDPEPGIETEAVPIPDGLPYEETAGTLTVILHEVPKGAIPYGNISVALNGINNAVFFGLPLGTCRFNSWDKKELFSPLGVRIYDIQYEFLFLPNVDLSGVARGWNYALRAVPGTGNIDYRPVHAWKASDRTVTGRGNAPYRSGSMNILFRPDQP
jgi:hypothetical protein